MIMLKIIRTSSLSENQIKLICNLKNQEWRFGIKSQLNFFKKNIKKNDLHNLLIVKEKIIGYTCLRRHKSNHYKKYIFLFDTIIIDKKYRNMGYAKVLMTYVIKNIKRFKRNSILSCNKDMIKFYKKYGWKILLNKHYERNNNNVFLIYNIK